MHTHHAAARSDAVEELTARVAHLLALLPDPRDPARWPPARHEPYVFLTVEGQLVRVTWHARAFDQFFWDSGNCFPTQHDAERAREALHGVVGQLYTLLGG